jgi:peptide/nickel transport system substrate-binding protein
MERRMKHGLRLFRVGMISSACALVLLAALAACSRVSTSNQSARHNPSTVPGIVRLSINAEPNTLNPVLSGLVTEAYVEAAMFNGLVQYDDRARLVPDLATQVPSLENGGISRDGRTITFHLRRGVKWQDGQPLTSADVAFTYSKYIDPKTNSFYLNVYKRIAKLETPDTYTVIVRLAKPFAPAVFQFFGRGSGGYVVPKHVLDHARDFNRDPFGSQPLGSGPFRLSRWDHGSLIVLLANPSYFGGAPHVREIDIHIVPNPNTQVAMLGSRDLDLATQLTPTQYHRVQGMEGVRTLLTPTYFERFLTFNCRREPFTDVRVRRALAMALDRHRIAETAYANTAIAADTLLAPYDWAYTSDNGAPVYDPQGAKNLLAQAGWSFGPDHLWHKSGRTLSFGLLNQAESNPLSTMAQEMQRDFHDIGVQVDLRQVPRNVIYGTSGLANVGKFDALVDDWGADTEPDRSNIIQTKDISPRGYNDAFYSDADVDRWSEAALATYDERTRKQLYTLIQRRLNRDVPYVPLVWEKRIYALNSDLRGFSPEPLYSDFWNVQRWQI